ncbi:TPA: hypothetical protein DIC39_02680 [Patescibacteria group bacterium]|nr:MAG: Type IV pilus assembly protein PilM [Parcubacteria group bacterium GW2011_GWA2_46_39]HBV33265.1 hypothetical protein [Patescibacteria group bacterium]HCU47939.1 hypothetical protein [Patescibacteria group bacterium]
MLFRPHIEVIGLDISQRSLKAVQFARGWSSKLKLRAFSDIELDKGIIVEGDIKQGAALTEAVKRLLAYPKYGKFNTPYVVSCLPEQKTFIKLVDIPPMSKEEIGQAIKWEAEHHIPIPIEETYMDWQLIGKPAPGQRLPVLLGVAPKGIVESYQKVLADAGLINLAQEIEAEAVTRALLPIDDSSQDTIMIVDLGFSRTSICLWTDNSIQFTVSLPLSGEKLTDAIAKTFNITWEEAEKTKIICGFDPDKCRGSLQKILDQEVDQLIKKIKETFDFYAEHFPNSAPVNQIMLCGGGANFKFIDSYLKDALGLPIVVGNPWLNLKSTPPVLTRAALLSYTTAVGLGLRVVERYYD